MLSSEFHASNTFGILFLKLKQTSWGSIHILKDLCSRVPSIFLSCFKYNDCILVQGINVLRFNGIICFCGKYAGLEMRGDTRLYYLSEASSRFLRAISTPVNM
jgi:hypothetical protein